jgi:hypothetical protein
VDCFEYCGGAMSGEERARSVLTLAPRLRPWPQPESWELTD